MFMLKVSLLEEQAPNPSEYLVLSWLFKLYWTAPCTTQRWIREQLNSRAVNTQAEARPLLLLTFGFFFFTFSLPKPSSGSSRCDGSRGVQERCANTRSGTGRGHHVFFSILTSCQISSWTDTQLHDKKLNFMYLKKYFSFPWLQATLRSP